MNTYSALTAEIARLQARAEQLRHSEKAGVIERIREAIEVYGITALELGLAGGAPARAAGKPAPAKGTLKSGVAKFQDPKSGKTWTGRGKPPTWIAGVKDRTPFMISGGASAPIQPVRAKRPAAARPVTVGVAKYRDPASGKTWTGRGKPPLWIVGAKNRDAFLIGGESAGGPAAAVEKRGSSSRRRSDRPV
jgi:DNA-binding protein H-NS